MDEPSKKDCRYIHGFAISGFRSFGSEPQYIGPLSKINLLIGQNNCGKSNILRFVRDYYEKLRLATVESGSFSVRKEDLPVRERASSRRCAIGVFNEPQFYSGLITRLGGGDWETVVPRALQQQYFDQSCGMIWFPLEILSLPDMDPKMRDERATLFAAGSMGRLGRQLLGSSQGNPTQFLGALDRQVATSIAPPGRTIHFIQHTRKWGTAGFNEKCTDGGDLVDRLARLHQAGPRDSVARSKWQSLLKFFRQVMGQPNANLEVPFDRKSISVFLTEQGFELDDLGTGIHEVIIIAALSIFHENSVICIEEPELHQHPRLQRMILKFLDEHTTNQYFISTHSAHLLDHPGAAVFHVRLTESGTVVTQSINPHQHSHVCNDLGYRASDLLQSNCVIWVEGPSDRLYIRKWLELADPSLVEGIHYSIMFYGGRLLSHLCPDDQNTDGRQDLDNFISLRKINRNLVVVIDSDRRTITSRVNATKKRIEDHFEKARANGGGGFVWITNGREIENYIPLEAMRTALAKLGKPRRLKGDRFEDYPGKLNKVRLAKELIDSGQLDLDVLDLRQRINKLAEFIKEANHQANPLPPNPPATR